MAASSQSGSGKQFWLLGGGVLLAIALYTGGWFYAASSLKNTVLKAIAPRDQAGVSGECSDIEFRGYPFRIGLFCSKIDVDDNVNGVSATFGALRSAAQVYAPGNIVWELDSPAEIRTSNGLSISAQWTNLQASLATRLQGVDRSSTVIEGLKAMAVSSYSGQAMLRMTLAKACWSLIALDRLSSSDPALSSIKSRQRSSTLPAEAGGRWPVSFSRTIIATASPTGASSWRSMPVKFALEYFSSVMAPVYEKHVKDDVLKKMVEDVKAVQ